MADPSPKHPDIEKFLEEIAGRTTSIKKDHCVPKPIGCGKPIGEFRDMISKREYRLSGLCQACQDALFGKSDDGGPTTES